MEARSGRLAEQHAARCRLPPQERECTRYFGAEGCQCQICSLLATANNESLLGDQKARRVASSINVALGIRGRKSANIMRRAAPAAEGFGGEREAPRHGLLPAAPRQQHHPDGSPVRGRRAAAARAPAASTRTADTLARHESAPRRAPTTRRQKSSSRAAN